MEDLGWTGAVAEFNDTAKLPHPSVTEPMLITLNGTILSGFGRWRRAILDGLLEVNCIEYPLDEDESLEFILNCHQIRRGWNDFVRICLALTLKPTFRQKALDNMSAGGKHKGLANLPDLRRIDVRQEIANVAGLSPRTVGNVETILATAHPQLLDALRDGTLRIGRAVQLCKLRKAKQLEELIRFSEERATNKVIRRCIPQSKEKQTNLDVVAVLDALRQLEEQQPGSVAVRVGRHKRTVVLIGQDPIAAPHSLKVLYLT